MKHIKLYENFNMIAFYHGSYDKLPNNTILKPHDKSYTKQNDNSYLESILEKYKPTNKLSRYESVFLVDDIENIDSAGGAIDYIYEVIVPKGIIPEKSDLAWYTEIDMVDDEEKQKEYALNYWNGIQFFDKDSSLWEYRVPKAYIVDLIEEN